MKKNILNIFFIIGFLISFHNTLNQNVFCFLYWIDHPYKVPYSINVISAQMDPGEKWDVSPARVPGKYMVEWKASTPLYESSHLFITRQDTKKIIATPEGIEIK